MDFVDVILVCVNNKFQAFNVHMVVRDAGLLATCVRIYIILIVISKRRCTLNLVGSQNAQLVCIAT